MEVNLGFELRAYEVTDACRLASILRGLTVDSQPTVSRDDVVAEWTERYPRHAAQTGRQSIRSRIGEVLPMLKVAGMVDVEKESIIVVDAERLMIAANNLEIVEDDQGVAVAPSGWPHRPEVPEHLLAVQAPLEASRQQAVAKES